MASAVETSNLGFDYPPLDNEERQIRVVTVNHIDAAGVVQCNLSTISLNEPPEYIALSYTWGPPPANDSIFVNESQFKVRHNLHDFLTIVAAKKLLGIPLFVDAICIDQSCLEEKNNQVPLMRDIYSCASKVIAWLGSKVSMLGVPLDMNNKAIPQAASLVSPLLIGYFQKGLQTTDTTFQTEQKLLKQLDSVTAVALFYALFSLFWSRVWIVQEVTLAKSLILQFAGHTIDGKTLEALLMAITLTISGNDSDPNQPSLDPIHSNVRIINIFLNIRAAENIFRQRVNRTNTVPLYQALIAWNTQRCTDPRDIVFGLFGISKSRIAVDYNISMTQLFLYVLIEGLLEIKEANKEESSIERRIAVEWNFCEACMTAFSYSRTDTTILHIMRSAIKRYGMLQDSTLRILWEDTYAWRGIALENWPASIHFLMSQYATKISLLLQKLELGTSSGYHQVHARLLFIVQKYKLHKYRSSDHIMIMPDGEACRYSEWFTRIEHTEDFLRGSGASPQYSSILDRSNYIRTYRQQMQFQKCFEIAIELSLAIVVVTIAVLLGALVKTTCASLVSFLTNLFDQQYFNHRASNGRAQEHIEL